MRLKYTTYDVRRGEDVIHLDSDTCNIMVRNPKYGEEQQPEYLHGQVLGIYHTYAYYSGELGPTPALPVHMEFLWVRWYESANLTEPRGALECVVFPDVASFECTTFIDPMSALRATHIIPRFSRGRKYPNGGGLSTMARDGTDWSQYYVNRYVRPFWPPYTPFKSFSCRFADRDMYMRYNIGMAVGHAPIWPLDVYTKALKSSGSQPIVPNLAPLPRPGEGQEEGHAPGEMGTGVHGHDDESGRGGDSNLGIGVDGDGDGDREINEDGEEEGSEEGGEEGGEEQEGGEEEDSDEEEEEGGNDDEDEDEDEDGCSNGAHVLTIADLEMYGEET